MSRLSDEAYQALLEPMQRELAMMARWVAETGQRVVVIFEGRDTAGKGGTIHAIARALSPRQCKVVSFAPPTEREQGQWYFQRYAEHLPAKGEIALFDRSWYSRAGVERVMGFCTQAEAKAFLAAVPHFERQLVEDGIFLFKYWLCCDRPSRRRGSLGGCTTRSKGGSCRTWMSPRASATPITRGRARICSPPPTPATRPGR